MMISVMYTLYTHVYIHVCTCIMYIHVHVVVHVPTHVHVHVHVHVCAQSTTMIAFPSSQKHAKNLNVTCTRTDAVENNVDA